MRFWGASVCVWWRCEQLCFVPCCAHMTWPVFTLPPLSLSLCLSVFVCLACTLSPNMHIYIHTCVHRHTQTYTIYVPEPKVAHLSTATIRTESWSSRVRAAKRGSSSLCKYCDSITLANAPIAPHAALRTCFPNDSYYKIRTVPT